MARVKSRKKIIYIDDSAVEREIVCRLLESEGCEVMATASPQTGLELARRRVPDLILLDLHMPEMDGYAAAERLREIPALKEVPIVALSATIRDEEREEVYERFDGFLKKPIDVESFPLEVQGYIEQGRVEAPHRAGGPGGGGKRTAPEAAAGDEAPDLLETLEKIRATMSHDLRTPLTVMISYAGTVGKEKIGSLSERQKEMLDLVVEQGFKMDALISELVRTARETLDRHGYPPE
jgi:CheY-like chemotaxis protein